MPDELGPGYSTVDDEGLHPLRDVHDRMPVILRRQDRSDWLDGPLMRLGCSVDLIPR